jgi:RHS repeat-associated protein
MNHNDHLATPQKMTDSTGTVVWAVDYKPFGKVNITTNTITNNLGFPGQYRDAETDLIYNYFRDLNPDTGKYIESDPLLQRFFFKRRNFFLVPVLATTPERLQPYSYVASNPINLFDSLGLYHCVGGANCNFTPDTDTALQCFDTCTGHDSEITSGRRPGGGQHGSGQACDLNRANNPDLSRPDAERCTSQCFPHGYGQEEQNGPNSSDPNGTHFHLQLNTVPGGQPGFGGGIRPYQPSPVN